MRVAAIDVGSNAIRLMMRQISSTGVATGAGYRRYALRLGTDVFRTGAVTRERAKELVTIFEDIAQRLDQRGVDKYRAVATSAMRDADNGSSLARRIKRQTGIDLEIIDGEQELRLARRVLMRSLGTLPPDALLIDLGGGSLEIERADRSVGQSVPFGTVRLLERFPELQQPVDLGTLGRIRAVICDELRRSVNPARKSVPLAVGTGGNLDVMARLMPIRGCPVPAIDVSRLSAFATRVGAMTAAKRVREFGVRADRADLMVPAVLVLLALVDVFQINALVVPGTGIRESLLHELVEPPTVHAAGPQILERFGQDPAPADRVAKTADRLFDLLSPLHQLWAPARGPLQAAAYLRVLGGVIDPKHPAKHGVYLVRNLPDLPLDDAGRRLAAAVLAMTYTRSSSLRRRLSARDKRVADVLCGLLEMATTLHHHDAARSLSVDILSNPLVLSATNAIPPRSVPTQLGRLLGRKMRVVARS